MPGPWDLTPAEAQAWDLDAHCCQPGEPCFAGAATLAAVSRPRAAWGLTPEEGREWDFDANCCAPDRPCWFDTLIAERGRRTHAGAPAAP